MARTRTNKNSIEIGDSDVPIFNGIIVTDEYGPELRGRIAF